MNDRAKGRRMMLSNIPPELWRRCKAEAALENKTLNEWVIEALEAKLEDAVDVREGLEALAGEEGTVTLEDLKREVQESRGAIRR